MAESAFPPHHIPVNKAGRDNKRQFFLMTRLKVESLEDRIVPSYFPSTASGIHVFEDQLPSGLSPALVQFLATHTDGTQKQLSSDIAQYRAINPNYTLLHYQLGTGNSSYQYIINNQWSSDWTYVNGQESWFAHQSYSGEPQSSADLSSGRVGNSTGWDQADIANSAWQQYTLGQVFQNMAATGANGWFADSFTYGIGAAGYNNPIPTRYQGTNAANSASWPGGVDWTTQLGNWAQTIENAFAQQNATNGTNYQFIPNLDARVTGWEPNWYLNSSGVPIVDGAFLEGFGQYTDTANWTLSMNRGLNFTYNNKIVIMQPYLSAAPNTATGQQERNFYLGTYLLLKGSESYLNMEYGSSPQYFPEYQLNLGAATTALPSNVSGYLWNGVYRRNFQNGFVLVNPGSTTHTLTLGGSYQEMEATGGGQLTASQLDANGNYIGGSLSYLNVSSITLKGGYAAIFLNPLTVATQASAAANPVAGTSVGLSVLGAENGSDAGLNYTWSSTGPAAVTYSDNGDNSAKNATAYFTQAGSYTLTATITDGSGQSVMSSTSVTVSQTLTNITVTPATPNVADGATQQFTATASDQFSQAISSPAITWSLSGVGTLSPTGNYTAPASGTGTATVTASSGLVNGKATVTVIMSITLNSVVINSDFAPVVGASLSSGTVTMASNGNSGFTAGNAVVIAGYSGANAGYNGTYTIATVSSNTFTYADSNTGMSTLTFNSLGYAISQSNSTNAFQPGLGSTNQRSMVDSIAYTFNEPVNSISSAVTLALKSGVTTTGQTKLSTGVPVENWTSLSGGSIWVATFSTATGNAVVGHSIADGVYTLSLNQTQVTDTADGLQMTSYTRGTDVFYRMFGDFNPTNGSAAKVVNAADTTKYVSSLNLLYNGGNAAYLAYYDFSGDGRINANDTTGYVAHLNSVWSGFTPTI